MTTRFSALKKEIGEEAVFDLEEALKNNDEQGYWYEAGQHDVDFHVAEQFYNLWQNGGIQP